MGIRRGELMKAVKKHKYPGFSAGDVMYNMMKIVNTAVHYI